MLNNDKIHELIDLAFEQLAYSYVPYSHFHVGAALLAKNGKVYTGCNIENASFGATNCAERTAFFKAVSEGVRDFDAICVVGGMEDESAEDNPKGFPIPKVTEYAEPCGICRQVMMEFCKPSEFEIILAKGKDDYEVFKLEEILPRGFGPGNLR